MRHKPRIVGDPLPVDEGAMPVEFTGGVSKIGRSGAASKEFTFSFPDLTAPPTPPPVPRPLPTPPSSSDREKFSTPPPSFGSETTQYTKYEFTFDAPKPVTSSIDPTSTTPSLNIPTNQTMPRKTSPSTAAPAPAPASGSLTAPEVERATNLGDYSLASLPPDVLRQGQLEVQAHEEEAELRRQANELRRRLLKPAESAKVRRRHTTCTHTKMVRVYSLTLRCDICQSYGPFGWLYRCTEDREVLLRHAILEGLNSKINFDDLGQNLCKLVKRAPRSADARNDVFSFFAEIDTEKMKTYTPEQISLILKQRENVRKVCREEMARMPDVEGPTANYQELKNTKPWVAQSLRECMHKVCPYCRPNGAERVYVSLDGVANGDVPATAATGFGFHIFGQRPVCDVSVVARAGLPKTKMVPGSSRVEDEETEVESPGDKMKEPKTPQRSFRPFLKGKLGYPLYSLDTTSDQAQVSNSSTVNAALPAKNGAAGVHDAGSNTTPVKNDSSSNNDSPGSDGSPGSNKGHLTRSHAAPNLPTLTANATPPPSNRRLIDGVVQKTSLHSLIEEPEEEMVPKMPATQMEKREMSTGHFEAKPLEVQDGVAVLEESVQLHTPDVISQV